MTLNSTHHFQLLPDEALGAFPEPIRNYIRYLRAVIGQQQQTIQRQQE